MTCQLMAEHCCFMQLHMQELTILSKSGNSVHESIEDDIRADLASLGISTVAVALPHDTYNQRDAVRTAISCYYRTGS